MDQLKGNQAKKCRSVEVQTEAENKEVWRRWGWLIVLNVRGSYGSVPSSKSSETQTEEVPFSSFYKPVMKEAATITTQQTITATSDFELWWEGVLESSEAEARLWKMKRSCMMARSELFSVMAEVYAGKIVQDEIDERERREKMSLARYLHLHFLEHGVCGTPKEARKAVVRVVTNVLAHVRGLAEKLDPARDPQGLQCHPRVHLFARFLALPHPTVDPVPVAGLCLFLSTLSRAQRGQMPLLPCTGVGQDRCLIPTEEFFRVLDFSFGNQRHVSREAIKHGLAMCNPEEGNVDLDLALCYTLETWASLERRFDARLDALLSTVIAGVDYDFETFDQVSPVLAF